MDEYKIEVTAKLVMLWEKQSDGRWRVVQDVKVGDDESEAKDALVKRWREAYRANVFDRRGENRQRRHCDVCDNDGATKQYCPMTGEYVGTLHQACYDRQYTDK
jgi:hypothetical protein